MVIKVDSQPRFRWDVRPIAPKENVVQGRTCRITVLESRLIRFEYAPNGVFEDRASQTAFYRDFPVCRFSCTTDDGVIRVQTEHLQITCRDGVPFSEDTLLVHLLQEPASTWHYADEIDDLGGTARTLDATSGPCPLDRGVCSRWGFSLLDDSSSMLLNEDGWVGVRQENTEDLYFFGFGYDHLDAVKALFRLTGVPALLPAYALGNWWSRYYAYTQQEYLDLMDRFRAEDLPFSVAVVDMDWHYVDIPDELKDDKRNYHIGWTGYSWNKELFPDHKAFLAGLKQRDLKTALNLHPAAGTACYEDMYPEMARANGIDPESRQRVRFDMLSREHMCSYFDILHHPHEEDGVDFWWMDWQQGTSYWWLHEPNKDGHYHDPRERMDPLWMLNHLHILDISRNGKRPMFFSRYAGPGSQRYPVGFSGDSTITWDTLHFQPYFTANASNVGYCWWSHDIGGHTKGYRDDELYVRWMQLGVFSPINRLHSDREAFTGKEPWRYEPGAEKILGDWLRLRHKLFPYLYTMNYRCHEELEPMVQPMYYRYPKKDGAYQVPNQFFFGTELMAAPITEKGDPCTGLGAAQLWLPEGSWFDFFTGLHYTGGRRGRRITAYRDRQTMPVFARPGAIVPLMVPEKHDNRLLNSDRMELLVFPGADNSFTVVEDAGDGMEYRHGANVRTGIDLRWGGESTLTILPARGELSLIPHTRTWRIGLRGFHKDTQVTVRVDGDPVVCTAVREEAANTTWVEVSAAVTSRIDLSITGRIHDNADVLERCRQIISNSQCAYSTKRELWAVVQNTERDLRWKNFNVWEYSSQESVLAKALVELLSLTADPFLGSLL